MKKSKISVRKLIFIVLGLLLTITTILALIGANVKTDLIQKSIPIEEEIIDTVVIHFIHGSIPEKNCEYQKQRLGGYLGGHIEIELSENIYGFLFDTLPINILPKERLNSKYEVRGKLEWLEFTKYDKITSINIPITKQQKKQLKIKLNKYLKSEPYDYAFFGQRCASSTAELLSDCRILSKFSNLESVIAFFYPRSLRFTMLKFADKNSLKVDYKKGINCHQWE